MLSITTNKGTETSQTQKVSEASFTCLLNDVAWHGSGFYGSHLYYTEGMSQMYDNKPFLTLSFKADKAPDNRQLTISIINFKPDQKIFKSEDLEVGLSGSASGDPNKGEIQGNRKKKNDGLSAFTVNITAWSQVNQNEAMISGTAEGTLSRLKNKENEVCRAVINKRGVINYGKVRVSEEK